jgi:phosphinothricin acetyltransferase
MTFVVRRAVEADLPEILAIYNEAVAHTTAIWNDDPVDLANRRAWVEARWSLGYPVVVAEEAGAVIGYGSFGEFRAFQGYRHTVEDSLYVAEAARRRGVAAALLGALIDEAQASKKHVMLAAITGDNEASIRLHARFGFAEVGRLSEVGTKFGRWLDLVLMQRFL